MIKIIKSKRNKNQIIHDHFIYELKRRNRGKIVWRCIIRSCPGSGYTDIDYFNESTCFHLNTLHNHEGDQSKALKKLITMR